MIPEAATTALTADDLTPVSDGEQEEMCDSRGDSYHLSPPEHCKIKPQLTFMNFVRSHDNLITGIEALQGEQEINHISS